MTYYVADADGYLTDIASTRGWHDFVTAVKDWFPGHADYLDSALSHWMFKRRFGGKPMVLRRDAATT